MSITVHIGFVFCLDGLVFQQLGSMDHSTLVCYRRAEYPEIRLTPQNARARLRLQCTHVQASMLGVVWKEGF